LAAELNTYTDLESAAGDWRRLAERSRNVFATWEWAAVWLMHHGAACRTELLACREAGGEPYALLPFCRTRFRALRMLRFVGHGPADQLGPVCASEDRTRAMGALEQALEALPRWDLFLGERLPGDASRGLPGVRLQREGNPVLPIGGRSWEELLASHSANFRQQVRRRERKLLREHGLAFRLTDSPGALPRDLDTLMALHRARWSGADTHFSTLEGFHRDFAAVALERGWLRLWIAELDGVPAAAWYGFRFGGVESFYQAGRDPALDRLSVGSVLLNHTIRAAVEDGMSEYRFLRGDEPYKQRFDGEDRGLDTLALARTRLGGAAIAGATAVLRRARGRALLRRLAA
jgi:CelD/BcsL family acetyltransferase involved in cellulose biosynthesis